MQRRMTVHAAPNCRRTTPSVTLCIGIRFIVNGILGIATDPAIVRRIREAAGP